MPRKCAFSPAAFASDQPLSKFNITLLIDVMLVLLVMRTDPEARYERFDQVLAEVRRAGIMRLGLREKRLWWSEANPS